jgi:hypothetical protein
MMGENGGMVEGKVGMRERKYEALKCNGMQRTVSQQGMSYERRWQLENAVPNSHH